MNWSPTMVTAGSLRRASETELSPTRLICSLLTMSATTSWLRRSSMTSSAADCLPAFDDDLLERRGAAGPTASGSLPALAPDCAQGERTGGGRQRNWRASRAPRFLNDGYVHGRPRSIWYTRARAAHVAGRRRERGRPGQRHYGAGGTVNQSGSSAFSSRRPNAHGRGPVVAGEHRAYLGALIAPRRV